MMFSRLPEKYIALILLCLWGGILLYVGAVRFDNFGLDEGAAHALLLDWSLSDQIVNPITTYGGPDFRALLFIPIAIYWPGSVMAAKVFTLIIMFLAAVGLYYWSRQHQSAENALIATGLLLLAPVTLQNVDNISVGPYLLLLFTIGAWVDTKYRQSPHAVSSLYFTQCVLVAITVTLHPIGLAYPAALAWHWYKTPKTPKQQKQVWLGTGIAVLIILFMQTGWVALQWQSNPAQSLDSAFWGFDLITAPDSNYWFGYGLLAVLVLVVVRTAKAAISTLMGSMLLVGTCIGLAVADQNWGLLATVMILFYGLPLLVQLNQKIHLHNFIGQRGLVMVMIFILTLLYLQGDKEHVREVKSGIFSNTDQLIATLAQEAHDKNKPFLAASQWPARTMIVCKRDVLPLPPPAASGQTLLKSIKGINYVVFNHRDPKNSKLAKNFAEITGQTETISIQGGGVIVKIKQPTDAHKNSRQGKIVTKPLTQSPENISKDVAPPAHAPTPSKKETTH